jgi:hypothetical protein
MVAPPERLFAITRRPPKALHRIPMATVATPAKEWRGSFSHDFAHPMTVLEEEHENHHDENLPDASGRGSPDWVRQ